MGYIEDWPPMRGDHQNTTECWGGGGGVRVYCGTIKMLQSIRENVNR